MSTHKKILTITGIALSFAVVLALPWLNGFKSDLNSIFAEDPPVCGDGGVDIPAEQCDDGNTVSGDGCSSACQVDIGTGCYFSFVEMYGMTPGACADSCVNSSPWDSYNYTGGYALDKACVCTGGTEEDCILNGGEIFGYGYGYGFHNIVSGYMVCGNSEVEFGETCDDGNTDSGDGCDSFCQIELCGNGEIDADNNEECDDGDLVNGDGCSSACQVENGVWDNEVRLTSASLNIADNLYGFSVDIHGNYAIVGAPAENSGNGSARIFYKDPVTGWAEKQKLVPPLPSGGGSFMGESVAIYNDYAVVGAPSYNNSEGAVYVYKKNGSLWTREITLQASEPEQYDNFGTSVDISGNYIAIGAPGDDETSNDAGALYIFVKPDITGTAVSACDTGFGGFDFIMSPDLTGDLTYLTGGADLSWTSTGSGYENLVGQSFDIIDGSPYPEDCPGGEYGCAFLNGFNVTATACDDLDSVAEGWEFKITGDWAEIQKVPGDGEYSNFGQSVSINGEYIAVGGPFYGYGYGAVVLLKNMYSEGWLGGSYPPVFIEGTGSNFGDSVSISNNYLAVGGAPGDADNKVYVFKNINGYYDYLPPAELSTYYPKAYGFGSSVYTSGNRVAISAMGDAEAGSDAGAVYVFEYGNVTGAAYNVCDDGGGVNLISSQAVTDAVGDFTEPVLTWTSGPYSGQEFDALGYSGDPDVCPFGDGYGCVALGDFSVTDEECGDVNDDIARGWTFEISEPSWNRVAKLKAGNAMAGSAFGFRWKGAAISGDDIVVGAPFYGSNIYGYGVGSAYAYELVSPVCGDGIAVGSEVCDDGELNGGYDQCNSSCSGPGPHCGDDTKQTAFGETCDDGNTLNGDGCSDTCELEICGDGILAYGEECDDGNLASEDGCSAACEIEDGLWGLDNKLALLDFQAPYSSATGYSIDIDGDYAIVGAPDSYNMFTGNRAGAAFIFKKEDGKWVKDQELWPKDLMSEIRFGSSVSISGDTAAVGAEYGFGYAYGYGYGGFIGAPATGETYIYRKNTDTVIQTGTAASACLPFPGTTAIDSPELTGQLKSYDGLKLRWTSTGEGYEDLVGRTYNIIFHSPGTCFSPLNCVVFEDLELTADCFDPVVNGWEYEIIEDWSLEADVVAGDGEDGDNFGASVDNQGDYAVVGAPYYGYGAAYVFNKAEPELVASGTADEVCPIGMWINAISSPDLDSTEEDYSGATLLWTSGNYAGRSFVITGQNTYDNCWGTYDCLILADFFATQSCSDTVAGNTFEIYREWNEQGVLVPDVADGGDSGRSVSISGDTIIVGSPLDFTEAPIAGSAHVYTYDGEEWSLEQSLYAGDADDEHLFGLSVSLDGDYAVIGAPGHTSAYVFKRTGGVWDETQQLIKLKNEYGASVSISGKRIAVGAPAQPHPDSLGALYLYERDGVTWSETEEFTAPDYNYGFRLGSSVAVNGINIAAGAPGSIGFMGEATGAAYMFALKSDVCGDGITWGDEECDDGNLLNADGCSSECLVEGTRFENDGFGYGYGYGYSCDQVEDGVCLWRERGGLVDNYDSANVEWACGECGTRMVFDGSDILFFCTTAAPENLPGTNACMHVVDSDAYYDIFWTGMDKKDIDAEENGVAYSYVRNQYDIWPPEPVTDLSLNLNTAPFLEAEYTQPADSGGGKIVRAELRYSHQKITNANWDSAALASTLLVDIVPEGVPVSWRWLNTLEPGLYYFAVKSFDDSGNVSDVNTNSASSIVVIPAKPVINSFTPASGVNDSDKVVTISGANFSVLGNYVVMIGASGETISLVGVGSTTSFNITIPDSMPAGQYYFYVFNEKGISAKSANAFTVTQSSAQLPVVNTIIPSYIANDADTDLTVSGENFTGATDVGLRTHGDISGSVYNQDFDITNDTEIAFGYGYGANVGYYDVIVETPEGANSASRAVLAINNVDTVPVGFPDPITTTNIADFSDFIGEEFTTLLGEFRAYLIEPFIANQNTIITSAGVLIPAGTTITDGEGGNFTGRIYPPHIVSREEAIDPSLYGELGENTVIFSMGDPNGTVHFDRNILISFDIMSETRPVLHYYNESTGVIELAGSEGDMDGVHYMPGGTVLGHNGNTYQIGVITDHLSTYLIGVPPSVSSALYSGGVVTFTGGNIHPDAVIRINGDIFPSTFVDLNHITAAAPGLAAGTYNFTVTNPDDLFASGSFTVTTTPPAAVCGNGTCEAGETSANCPADCRTAYVPTGGGGGGGSSREQLLARKKTEVKPEFKPEPAPVMRPAAPTVSQVVTTIVSAFKDIKSHWAEAYINRLYSQGIISGKTATKFAPNDKITRAEVVKMALMAFNYKIPSRLTYAPFPDVKMTDWYAPYAQVAREQGIIKGFPEGMRPNEFVSRAEALKILLTASKLPLISTSAKNFTDTTSGAWYMYYVRYAFENGIIAGYADGTFRPAATITRAEIAKITVKIMDMVLQ